MARAWRAQRLAIAGGCAGQPPTSRSDRHSAAEHFSGLHGEAAACLAIHNVAHDVGCTAHGTLRLRHEHGGDRVPDTTAIARAHGIVPMTGPRRHRRSLRVPSAMTGWVSDGFR
jgi:hypothetical protein